MKHSDEHIIKTINELVFMLNSHDTRAAEAKRVKHDPKLLARWWAEVLRELKIRQIFLTKPDTAMDEVYWDPGRPTKANGRWTNKRKPCPVCRNGRRFPRTRCARCLAERGETLAPEAPKGPYHDAT